MPEFMPIMVDVENLPCLVVGGGKVAQRKVLDLLRFKAKITVIATGLTYGLHKLHGRGLIRWKRKHFSLFDLFSQRLVIAATHDPELNRKVCLSAAKLGRLCNAVDAAKISGFIFPAIHKQGPLVLSVSTQGICPSLSRTIKRKLAINYSAVYQDVALKLGSIRKKLQQKEPDFQKRRRILNRLTNLEPEKLLTIAEDKLEGWLSNVQK